MKNPPEFPAGFLLGAVSYRGERAVQIQGMPLILR
jgi:hypothetical protein